MTLPEARKKLSGFTFDKVFAGNNIGLPDVSFSQKYIFSLLQASFMEPAVLTAYMDFIRHQRWITSAMLSSYTSMEILNIVKPKILRISDYNMANIPVFCSGSKSSLSGKCKNIRSRVFG